jgi:hypothetical protein
LMHATPGEMKSFRVSAERIALMLKGVHSARVAMGNVPP